MGGSDLGMRFEILLGTADDLALSAIGELFGGFIERKPECLADFNAHVFSNFVDAACLVAEEEEADDLEDFFAVAPGTNVDVLDICELGNKGCGHPGLFANFAERCIGGLFSVVDQTFGKSEHQLARMFLAGGGWGGNSGGSRDGFGQGLASSLVLRLDGSDVPGACHAAQDDTSSRELANHAEEFTGLRRWFTTFASQGFARVAGIIAPTWLPRRRLVCDSERLATNRC